MDIIKRRNECNTIKDVVLANVGMTEEEFLHPKKDYNIDLLDDATEIINNFIKANKLITVVADYDADGICAASILKLALNALGARFVIRLPKRFSEGYGLSEKIVNEIDEGLLITVDNGIAAVDAIQKAKDKGLTVIVTDHHLAPEDGVLPNADIVIDPNAIPDSADFNGYCGAGIAYKLAVKLLGKEHKLIPKLTSLAAIATIADVMSLTEENRKIVKDGLSHMVTYAGRTTGLGALLERCDMDKYISEKNIAFKIGPIINAAGRMSDDGAITSFETISFNSRIDTAKEMAESLYQINEDRKTLKETGLKLVRENIKENCLFGDVPMTIYEPGLPEGLVGIFAGKIAEEFRTPCFVFTDSDEPGIIKGSGRTYGEINIKELLDVNSELLHKYGGHAEAAGVSIKKENLEDLRYALINSITEPTDNDSDSVYYDIEISADEINNAMKEIGKFAPFGMGNPEIVFYIKNFTLSPNAGNYYRSMGEKGQHVKLFGVNADAVGFDMKNKFIEMGEPKTLNLVGTISKNYFRGKFTNQIEILEMENADTQPQKSSMASLLSRMATERYM